MKTIKSPKIFKDDISEKFEALKLNLIQELSFFKGQNLAQPKQVQSEFLSVKWRLLALVSKKMKAFC